MSKQKTEKLAAVRALLERHAITTYTSRFAELGECPQAELDAVGMTLRGLLQFVRLNADALRGSYRSAEYHRADPRAFNCTARQAYWKPARFYLYE